MSLFLLRISSFILISWNIFSVLLLNRLCLFFLDVCLAAINVDKKKRIHYLAVGGGGGGQA